MDEQVPGIIRPMTEADLDIVLSWRNHSSVRQFMYTHREISLAEHESWFASAVHDPARHLAIYEEDGDPSGYVNFHRINDRTSEWGFYTAPLAAKGTGHRMGVAAADHAFLTLACHKLYGRVLGFNERSIRFHLRLGFTREGILRRHHFDGNSYHDIHCFGLLIDEWAKRGQRH